MYGIIQRTSNMNTIGINKWQGDKHIVYFLLCLLTFFGLPYFAYGQAETKTIDLSKLFSPSDFKGAPTVSKTTDGFTIILEKAAWDAARNAVMISSGGTITINSQQKTDKQKGYLFNKIVFDKLGTFNQTRRQSRRGDLDDG